MPPYVTSAVIGYLIGSFPSAFLFVKRKNKLDIRTAGSGNVGAMNAFEVTNSKIIGLAVLLTDLLKGILAVYFTIFLVENDRQIAIVIASIAVVIGHNYPVWLKFKGGRGLSTAAGVMLILNWFFVALWGVLWGVLYKFFKNIHKANIVASVAAPCIMFLLPDSVTSIFLSRFLNRETAFYVIFAVCFLILLRHSEQIRSIVTSNNQS